MIALQLLRSHDDVSFVETQIAEQGLIRLDGGWLGLDLLYKIL